MKAILSLVVLLSTVNVFAGGAARRADFLDAQRVIQARQFCEKNAEYCKVRAEAARLNVGRDEAWKAYQQAKLETPQRLCAQLQNIARSEVDGQGVKYPRSTPCDRPTVQYINAANERYDSSKNAAHRKYLDADRKLKAKLAELIVLEANIQK